VKRRALCFAYYCNKLGRGSEAVSLVAIRLGLLNPHWHVTCYVSVYFDGHVSNSSDSNITEFLTALTLVWAHPQAVNASMIVEVLRDMLIQNWSDVSL
jgi:hypothetical protein